MEIYTIGFAGKTAEQFFEALKRAGVQQLVDVRLNNLSQLAGFTKRADLPYLLDQVAGIAYLHEPRLAPTKDALRAYRSGALEWSDYEAAFLELMAERTIPASLVADGFAAKIALLCSEATAERCHRRLVAEILADNWGVDRVEHL